MITPTRSGRKLSARKLWGNVHLGVALTAGIVLLTLGVTGALLALKGPLLRWELGEEALRVSPRPIEHAPVGQWIEHARKTYPQIGTVLAVTSPNSSPLSTNAGLLTVMLSGGEIAFVTVDPYTARPLALFPYQGTFFFKLLDLHRSLLLPDGYGETVLAWCGIALLVSLGTGTYLWWPRGGRWRDGFLVSTHASGKLLLRQLHSVCAAWLLLPLLLLAVSGIAIAKPEWLTTIVGRFSSVNVSDPMQTYMGPMHDDAASASCGQPTSVDAAISLALRAVPGAAFASLGGGGSSPYSLRLKRSSDTSDLGDSEVVIDSRCPRVLHVTDSASASAGDTIFQAVRPLHAHLLLGQYGWFIVMLAGLALPALFATGVLFWVKRSLPRWRERSAR